MNAKIESEAIILAAGLQTRYKSEKSKLMALVQGKPAFHITMESILDNFPENLVTIVSSKLFPDFNSYVTQEYPNSRLVIDESPGCGSANSLKVSLPWKTEDVFISEGNIAYAPQLPRQMHEVLMGVPSPLAVLAATNKLDVVPTHKIMILDQKLQIRSANQSIGAEQEAFRNMGVYTVRHSFEEQLTSSLKDIIDVFSYLNETNIPIVVVKYYSYYLHTATIKDVDSWIKADL